MGVYGTAESWRDLTEDPRDTARPRFYLREEPDPELSAEKGRSMFRSVEMVEIITPGDHLNITHKYVRDPEKLRWPRHYEAWKKGQETPLEGTPLDQWAVIPRERVLELQAANIRTVEELADVTDIRIPRRSDWRTLRQHAQNWLLQAEKNSGLTKLQSQIDKQTEQIEKQSKQIDALLAQNQQLQQPATDALSTHAHLETAGVQAPTIVADSDADRDIHDKFWDAELHDPRKLKTKAGVWMKRRGKRK